MTAWTLPYLTELFLMPLCLTKSSTIEQMRFSQKVLYLWFYENYVTNQKLVTTLWQSFVTPAEVMRFNVTVGLSSLSSLYTSFLARINIRVILMVAIFPLSHFRKSTDKLLTKGMTLNVLVFMDQQLSDENIHTGTGIWNIFLKVSQLRADKISCQSVHLN